MYKHLKNADKTPHVSTFHEVLVLGKKLSDLKFLGTNGIQKKTRNFIHMYMVVFLAVNLAFGTTI